MFTRRISQSDRGKANCSHFCFFSWESASRDLFVGRSLVVECWGTSGIFLIFHRQEFVGGRTNNIQRDRVVWRDNNVGTDKARSRLGFLVILVICPGTSEWVFINSNLHKLAYAALWMKWVERSRCWRNFSTDNVWLSLNLEVLLSECVSLIPAVGIH